MQEHEITIAAEMSQASTIGRFLIHCIEPYDTINIYQLPIWLSYRLRPLSLSDWSYLILEP